MHHASSHKFKSLFLNPFLGFQSSTFESVKMAPSLANVKVFASMFSNSANRRGFAAVAQGVEKVLAKKPAVKEPAAWIPDSEGVYRPENSSNEIDVAELREMLLKQSKIAKK